MVRKGVSYMLPILPWRTYEYGGMKAPEFTDACSRAGIVPTRRQWRRWTNKTGAAYARREV